MSLSDQIIEQYGARIENESFYNSTYTRLSEAERTKAALSLVKHYLGNTKNKSVLEIGAGQGANVGILKICGFNNNRIFLNELLPERILAVKKDFPDIKLYEGDALKLKFDEQYDCVFQSTVFTSILNQNDRIALAKKMWDLLNPRGIILWYDFIYNNPSNPHVRKVDISELKSLFPEAKNISIKKITLAPPIGRRVGKLYPLFNLPFLRSHIIAVLQK